MMFDAGKTRRIGLPCSENMLRRFHFIPERHGQTNGRSEPDIIAILMSRVSVLTHDKNRISVGYKVTTIVLRPGLLLLVYVS